MQKTRSDDDADVRIFEMSEQFICTLCNELQLDIPSFKLIRRIKISKGFLGKRFIEIEGLDEIQRPYSFFKQIEVVKNDQVVMLIEEPIKVRKYA